MNSKDWKAFLILVLSFLPGKILKIFHPNIWVISEYEMMARDNGYWFYKYIRENHPEVEAYYPLNYDSPDYPKIEILGNCIVFGGFYHYCLFWAAKIYCSSASVQGFPYPRICEDIVLSNFHSFKYIFLNHGITRGYSYIVNNQNTNYNLLCVCSEFDKNIIIKENGQSDEIVKVTGYARHDNLDNEILDNSLILIMPTWRTWLSYRNEISKIKIQEKIEAFLHSKYYRFYSELINNEELIGFLEENNLNIIFYLHQYAQPFADYFSSVSDRIEVGRSSKFDVQTLLKKASLLITDYSSVCYDYAYMFKPVLYYQFDINEFESKQYGCGKMFSYFENGLGDVCFNINDLINCVKLLSENKFSMPDKYKERVKNYFAYCDKNNCKRIFETILDLTDNDR